MPILVDDKYRINIFLDTNILIDILDNTYDNLTHTIEYLKSSDFTTLKSSHYVMFEMIENRKWKYFVEKVSTTKTPKKYSWKINGIQYTDHKDYIQQKVEGDKDKICNDYNITWEENILHDELLAPTLDLCLESTISREDSLVLLSSIFPKKSEIEKQVLLMSRDKAFNKSTTELGINTVFAKHGLTPPEMMKTGCLSCNKFSQTIDLTLSKYTKEEIICFWKQKIIETIIKKNRDTFLGHTYSYNNKAGANCIFFKLPKSTSLNKDIGLTIIGKNLDFIYSTQIIPEFWSMQRINDYPFLNENNESLISFKIDDFKDKFLFAKIKEKGNLIFLNTDTL